MKKYVMVVSALICFLTAGFIVADYPEAYLSNAAIKAKLFLPNAKTGYYRGTRFDWAGVMPSLEYKGHTYFGQWFPDYDPRLHDAIQGPVEEFVALDFDATGSGEEFVKIGVGGLIKPDDKPYAFARYYDIKNPGTWSVDTRKDAVTFTHELKDAAGYSYLYKKTVRLAKDKPELVLEHSLKNTGKKPIETKTYNHNFFMIDNEPSSPNIRIVFPFEVKGKGEGFGTIINANEKALTYSREVKKGDQVFSAGLEGFGTTAKDYDIRIENTKTKAGVRITSDQPLDKLVYWACPTTSCPEPYVRISVAPGAEMKWKVNYEFYTF